MCLGCETARECAAEMVEAPRARVAPRDEGSSETAGLG